MMYPFESAVVMRYELLNEVSCVGGVCTPVTIMIIVLEGEISRDVVKLIVRVLLAALLEQDTVWKEEPPSKLREQVKVMT